MVFDLMTLTSNARGHLLEKQHARCCSLCWFWFDSFRHVPTCSFLWFLFRNLQAGGMAVLLLAMPTKLWSLDRKRMWTHILVPALLKLLTSCYSSVFHCKIELYFSNHFRRISTTSRFRTVQFSTTFRIISVGITNSPLTNYRLDYVGQC